MKKILTRQNNLLNGKIIFNGLELHNKKISHYIKIVEKVYFSKSSLIIEEKNLFDKNVFWPLRDNLVFIFVLSRYFLLLVNVCSNNFLRRRDKYTCNLLNSVNQL